MQSRRYTKHLASYLGPCKNIQISLRNILLFAVGHPSRGPSTVQARGGSGSGQNQNHFAPFRDIGWGKNTNPSGSCGHEKPPPSVRKVNLVSKGQQQRRRPSSAAATSNGGTGRGRKSIIRPTEAPPAPPSR